MPKRNDEPSDVTTAGQPDRSPEESAYLAALGDALRQARAVRGMSRKVLASVSGVSERYIAQAESGQGNLSLLVLRRIAAATGTSVEDLVAAGSAEAAEWRAIRDLLKTAGPARVAEARALLSGRPEAQADPAGKSGRIALIGLRGAGKSTLGRMAAERLGWPFVELNREIEREAGFTITELFAIYGQDGYRRHEQAALRTIAARPGPFLMATGGGIVAEPLTFDLLLSSFYTVWIKATPEEHMERVRAQGDLRPMGNDRSAMTELIAILSSREPLYRRADATVHTSGASVDQSLLELIEVVREAAA